MARRPGQEELARAGAVGGSMSKAAGLGVACVALFGCGIHPAAAPSGPAAASSGAALPLQKSSTAAAELPTYHGGCGGGNPHVVAEAYAAYRTTFGPTCTVATPL